MTIKITEPKKEGQRHTLTMSKLLPFEYAVLAKTFDEPKVGQGKRATGETFDWYLYGLEVHEYVSTDENTGEKVSKKFDTPLEVSSFMSAKTFREGVDALPVGVKFKVKQTKEEGAAYSVYVIETLDAVAADVAAASPTPAVSLADKIATLKGAGITQADALPLLQKEYETATPEMVAALWG